MFKKIMVAIDGSEISLEALKEAENIATFYHGCGFKVLVQHQYPGASRNEGVAHGPLPTPDSYGT